MLTMSIDESKQANFILSVHSDGPTHWSLDEHLGNLGGNIYNIEIKSVGTV